MRSIAYAGHDFSELCGAQVVERCAHAIDPVAIAVPGRAGALVVAGYVPPQDVRVRLFLDAGFKPGGAALAAMRHELRRRLCLPDGGVLVLPDDPELEYRDALLTDAGTWSDLFECGECEVVFTLFDPIAYGASRLERGEAFEVGGTWATWPVFELVASSASSVGVYDAASGRHVFIEGDFAGGETVRVDCTAQAASIDGVDARASVSLGSDFFALPPGEAKLGFTGCASHEVAFRERWL